MSGEEGNKKYRDSLFCSYFNEPKRLLSLCNAVLGTDYSDVGELNINTLEGIFFDDQKNDISCTIGNHFLVLMEHQSTVNENMPFRCLSYVAELLNKLVDDKQKLYRRSMIKFPAPRFFVFYNGEEKELPERKMKLSDAFGGDSSSLELIVHSVNINLGLHADAFDGDNSALELIVTAYNINREVNLSILRKCKYLSHYSTFVGKVKEGIARELSRRAAIINAVKFCIENGIMRDYLEEKGEEVFNMLALEWNMNDALEAKYADGLQDGFQDGRESGIESVARNMIFAGEPFEKICEFTKLSLERIAELAKNLNK